MFCLYKGLGVIAFNRLLLPGVLKKDTERHKGGGGGGGGWGGSKTVQKNNMYYLKSHLKVKTIFKISV
jgi:hypothetical protein